jgi:pimeloyl-ACP methyl ester carboxylesterase
VFRVLARELQRPVYALVSRIRSILSPHLTVENVIRLHILSSLLCLRPCISDIIVKQDLRNHGDSPHNPRHDYLSMANDVAYFLESHKLSSPTIIGHSMYVHLISLFSISPPLSLSLFSFESFIVTDSPVHNHETHQANRTN